MSFLYTLFRGFAIQFYVVSGHSGHGYSMGYGWFQRLIYAKLIRNINRRFEVEDEQNLKKSAIVFSPHFDDETLGCGGTIIRKTQAGAKVRIAYMTDGSTSHRHLISEAMIKSMRAEEGLQAARCLGLGTEDVTLLSIEDGQLGSCASEATQKVTELIEIYNPSEVYIPHRRDPLLWSSDHQETNRIVKQVLRNLGKKPVIYEYPVWYWYHWPWVSIDWRQWFHARIILKNTVKYRCGLGAAKDFNHFVLISNLLDQKQAALEQHKSQMSRIIPDSNWITLKDISNGEFVKCFFRDHEFFSRYEYIY